VLTGDALDVIVFGAGQQVASRGSRLDRHWSTLGSGGERWLRINMPVSFGVLHLAPPWPLLARRYPEVELDIALSDHMVDLVEEGFDLVVRISHAGTASHIARKLATWRSIVRTSPDCLARHGTLKPPAELKDHICLGDTARAAALAGQGIIW
jgi:DNA-binding transcriptional LysR family regulator